MITELNQFEIGDRLYIYYIAESQLNRSELIIKSDEVYTREAINRALGDDDYIIAISGDDEEWWIGLDKELGVLYLVSKDGLFHDMEMVISEKLLDTLPIDKKESFKLLNPRIQL